MADDILMIEAIAGRLKLTERPPCRLGWIEDQIADLDETSHEAS